MTLSLLICNYNGIEYLEKCLSPWLEFRSILEKQGNRLLICILDGKFQEFGGEEQNSTDGSLKLLHELMDERKIDALIFPPKGLNECQVRDMGLKWLLEKNIDFLWLSAPDEIYSLKEIQETTNYIQNQPFIQTFRIEFKNLVFSDRTFMKGFCPTRIFKNDQYKINNFRGDDEVNFSHFGGVIDYAQLPIKKIPLQICNPLHYTWLDNQRSQDKINYQKKRWGENGCSFTYIDGKLEFNPIFHKQRNISFPEIFKINE